MFSSVRCRIVGGEVWLRHPLRKKVVLSNPMDTKMLVVNCNLSNRKNAKKNQ